MLAPHLCFNGTIIRIEEAKAYFVCLTPERKVELREHYSAPCEQDAIGILWVNPAPQARDAECLFNVLRFGKPRPPYSAVYGVLQNERVYNSQVRVKMNDTITLENPANPADNLKFHISKYAV